MALSVSPLVRPGIACLSRDTSLNSYHETHYKEQHVSALSLRLPDDIDTRLSAEAALEGTTRSDVARLAIDEYLKRRERERFMDEMVAEARKAYADPDIVREALEIAEDTVDDGLDAIIADERAAGSDPDEPWWR